MSSFFLPFLLGHENASGACSEAKEVHLLAGPKEFDPLPVSKRAITAKFFQGIRQKQSGRRRTGAGLSPEAMPSRESQKKDEELRSDRVGSGLNTQACRAKNAPMTCTQSPRTGEATYGQSTIEAALRLFIPKPTK